MSKNIITTETPIAPMAQGSQHTLSILVNNTPGVLMRICQVFSRRGFNIDSLVVSEGRNHNFSRMTIGVSGESDRLEQIIMQVSKLIDVIQCCEHTYDHSVSKELLLVKIACRAEQRSEALHITEHFNGKTVDLTPSSMVVMLAGDTQKIDAALVMFSKMDIIETVRTGKVVMARGDNPT